MSSSRKFGGKLAAAALLLAIAIVPAHAADAAPPPSQNAVINLIRLLVKQGVLSQKQADDLVAQAEAEAAQARVATQAPAPVPAPLPAQAPTQTAAANELPPPAPGAIRVPYVPESVKKKIADEVRKDVMAQVEKENWARPEAIPEWTRHIKVYGDFRFRSQSDLYSKNNIGPCINPPLPPMPPDCAFDGAVDFATFNDQGPIDINASTNPTGLPFLNTRVNRPFRESIRARLGLDVDLVEDVFVGVRLATGQNNGPVSTTQLLGGGWGKKDIWLDQAYVKFTPAWWGSLTAGRMPDPFLHTDLVYDDDLNFDGIALAFASKKPGSKGLSLAGTAGFFPLEYGSSNFPTFNAFKTHDVMKWMQGGQVVAQWTAKDWTWKVGVAYYDYEHVRGQFSSPCVLFNGNKACDTDQTRPAFMQKGNTLFLLRNIVPDPAHPLDTALPQFVGLSFDYNILNATTELDFDVGRNYRLTFSGDYAHNLAFDAKKAYALSPLAIPVNNFNANAPDITVPAALQSGADAYKAKVTFGHARPSEAWEWNIGLGYRYVEADAVLDAFTDSDFHLGGTNARGYFLEGVLGLFHNTSISARWLSGSEVSGPPLAIDVFQLDLNTGF